MGYIVLLLSLSRKSRYRKMALSKAHNQSLERYISFKYYLDLEHTFAGLVNAYALAVVNKEEMIRPILESIAY